MKQSKHKRYIFVLLILIIGIGYAVITASLNINANIVFKQNIWDVHFENIQVLDSTLKNGTATINNNDDTVINFGGNFSKPGEHFEFSAYVVNSGTVVASLDEIKLTGIGDEIKSYFNYTVTYYAGSAITKGDELTAGGAVKVIVYLEYKYDVNDFVSIDNLNVTVSLKYVTAKDAENGVWNYDFVDMAQEFIAPYTGTYKLEVWGAQGGDGYNPITQEFKGLGGYGGYSVGNLFLNKNEIIYIYVGGAGTDCSFDVGDVTLGGFNGGGFGGKNVNTGWGAGGGATHIAWHSGLLTTFKDKINELLIVAGGGGGAGFFYVYHPQINNGGSGGGYIGNSGENSYNPSDISYGATQFNGGSGQSNYNSGSFGSGGTIRGSGAAGGGAGFYGGGVGHDCGSSGAGGSGYIGSENLTEKAMYCYNCQEPNLEDENYDNIKTISTTNVSEEPISQYAKIGNGFARITLISK